MAIRIFAFSAWSFNLGMSLIAGNWIGVILSLAFLTWMAFKLRGEVESGKIYVK